MIGYIRGKVSHIFNDHCFVDVQGVGYRIFIATSTRQKLTIGDEVSVFTYMHVREDALLLYGFYTHEEYELFLNLMSINGIGPKVAMAILSAVEPSKFCLAISQKNINVLTKIPGIGKKTAERMILELKDKIGLMSNEDNSELENLEDTSAYRDIKQEAIDALMALGYNQAEIMPIVNKFTKNATSVEDLIKAVLREFSRG